MERNPASASLRIGGGLAACLLLSLLSGVRTAWGEGGYRFQEFGGVVSMEAEHFTANQGYTVRTDNGPSGIAAGWSGDGWIFSDSQKAQRLDYEITFTKTGKYYVHLRALAGYDKNWDRDVSGIDNGYHAEFDGKRISGPGIYVTKPKSWVWYGRYQTSSSSVSFDVDKAGKHTFSIIRREELSRLDKIVLHDGKYGTTPESTLTGKGPPETLEGSGGSSAGSGGTGDGSTGSGGGTTGGGDGAIALWNPLGGESLAAGSVQDIVWTSTGTISSVTIEVSTDGGNTWQTLVGSTENDGQYAWTVPATLGSGYRIRVSDSGNSAVYGASLGDFQIVDTAGSGSTGGGQTTAQAIGDGGGSCGAVPLPSNLGPRPAGGSSGLGWILPWLALFVLYVWHHCQMRTPTQRGRV